MADPMVDMIRKAGSDARAARDKQAAAGSTPEPIEQNPKAMQLVDELKSMGYTADDVAQAMGEGGQEDEQQDSGAQVTMAAPMQIPGT
jgi:hypothetical protein